MPKISVIVPVYKVEKYIRRCIDSILLQKFTDFELILVDDGSPDNCGAICDKYAITDKRVRVLHQKNGGVSRARNSAIEIARGEYITFVDSDDWLDICYLERLFTIASQNAADTVIASINRVNCESEIAPVISDEYIKLSNREAINYCGELNDEKFRSAVAKLVKRNIVQKHLFPEGRKWSEDTAVVYKWYWESEKIIDTNDQLYYYWENPEGVTSNTNFKVRLGEIDTLEEQLQFFEGNCFDGLYEKFLNSYMYNLSYQHKLCKQDYKDERLAKKLKRKLQDIVNVNKKTYPITMQSHPYVYEALYPNLMWLYWTWKGICNKFR